MYLGANVLGLSPTALWLGTPDGSQPLKRLDRASLEAHVIRDLPQDHFVSAIAGDAAGGAWAAWSRKQWEGGSYTVTTWVARIEDSARVVATRDAELR